MNKKINNKYSNDVLTFLMSKLLIANIKPFLWCTESEKRFEPKQNASEVHNQIDLSALAFILHQLGNSFWIPFTDLLQREIFSLFIVPGLLVFTNFYHSCANIFLTNRCPNKTE